MADISISKSRGKKYLGGSSPMVPSFIVGDDPIPLNPPGSPVSEFTGIGIKINGRVIGGVKKLIELTDILTIPIYYEYNVFASSLDVDGLIENEGEINYI